MADQRIERWLAVNRDAVATFEAAARAVSDDAFHQAIAPGKWSPAAHVDHVVRAYEAAVADIERNEPMQLIGTPRQRRFWRLVGLTIVKWFGRLPHAKAPREIRPADFEHRSRAESLEKLDEHVRDFERVVRTAGDSESPRGFRHPYFGALSLHDGIRLLSVHTRHHARAFGHAASK